MISYQEVERAASVAEKAIGRSDVAIVLGSGLGNYAETFSDLKKIRYAGIPGFPKSTVPGHAGELISGEKDGKRVIIMNGRFHMYEGIPLDAIAMPIRVMRLMGVQKLIVTNAAGGVNLSFKPGDLMMITDYINLTGRCPLVGANMDELGPRFPDMSHVFTKELQEIGRSAAKRLNMPLREGVYCWMSGPCFETPAEIRMIRILGADAVGMSTVPDAMTASHAGMSVMGISCITNMAAGILDQPITHQEVLETGRQIQDQFRGLIDEILKAL